MLVTNTGLCYSFCTSKIVPYDDKKLGRSISLKGCKPLHHFQLHCASNTLVDITGMKAGVDEEAHSSFKDPLEVLMPSFNCGTKYEIFQELCFQELCCLYKNKMANMPVDLFKLLW